MPTAVYASSFKRDVRRMERRGKDMGKLRELIQALAKGQELAQTYRDHALRGDWKDYRDAHIEPDWLLVYKLTEDELLLARTGTHADLFGK